MFAKPVIALIGYDDLSLLWVYGGIGEVLRLGQYGSISSEAVAPTAGLPREHRVMAWKSVDLPTLANPTIPLLRLLPGLPSSTFSCLASFFGPIVDRRREAKPLLRLDVVVSLRGPGFEKADPAASCIMEC